MQCAYNRYRKRNTGTDIDGNTYKIFEIGTQRWISKKLKVTRFRNGEPITKIKYNSEYHLFPQVLIAFIKMIVHILISMDCYIIGIRLIHL